MHKKAIDNIKKIASEYISIDESLKDEDLRAFIMDKARKNLKNESGMIENSTVLEWTILFYKENSNQETNEKTQLNADGDQLSLWDA